MRLELVNHSPSGFDWGPGGSGPAQLALALLADCLLFELCKILRHSEIRNLHVGAAKVSSRRHYIKQLSVANLWCKISWRRELARSSVSPCLAAQAYAAPDEESDQLPLRRPFR